MPLYNCAYIGFNSHLKDITYSATVFAARSEEEALGVNVKGIVPLQNTERANTTRQGIIRPRRYPYILFFRYDLGEIAYVTQAPKA